MKFDLADPAFLFLVIGLLLIVGCFLAYGSNLNILEGFAEESSLENEEDENINANNINANDENENENTNNINSENTRANNTNTTNNPNNANNANTNNANTNNANTNNVNTNNVNTTNFNDEDNADNAEVITITSSPDYNLEDSNQEDSNQEDPNQEDSNQEDPDQENFDTITTSPTNNQIPSLHTPTPDSLKLLSETPAPSPTTKVTESCSKCCKDGDESPDENAKSNSSNEKCPWARGRGIYKSTKLSSIARIPNISQVGGEGPSNYFHPNIIISRGKKSSRDEETKKTNRIEFGLGKEVISLLGGMSNGNGGNGGNSKDKWTKDNWEDTYYDPDKDPLTIATKSNIRSSYSQELKQKGETKLCHKDIDTHQENSNQETFKNGNAFQHNSKMKEYHPGYQYTSPDSWAVPHKRPPVCLGCQNKCLPSGVFDRGTPLNALGTDTQVGSIMPKFTFTEHPRS